VQPGRIASEFGRVTIAPCLVMMKPVEEAPSVAPDDGAWHGLAAIRFEIEPLPD
jgi:hypothetical protein